MPSPSRLSVRSASISGYAELVRKFGLDPANLARQVGLNLRSLATPDNRLPAFKVYRLLELSAAAAGTPEFGLMLAGKRGLSHLGALGLLVRDEPDVRRGLQRIATGMKLHSTCVVMQLLEEHGFAVVTLNVLPDGETNIRQSVEAAVALLHQILTALLGPGWRPLEVQFVHAAGSNTRAHRQFFACPVRFACQHNAVVLRSSDLDQPVPGADQGFRSYTRSAIPAWASQGSKVGVNRVRHAILQTLPSGQCTSEAVARHLGIHRRTLHRHLGEEGLDFTTLLDAMRLELAQQYLEAGELKMTEISQLLGFNAASSFSRWFGLRTQLAPRQWRAK